MLFTGPYYHIKALFPQSSPSRCLLIYLHINLVDDPIRTDLQMSTNQAYSDDFNASAMTMFLFEE